MRVAPLAALILCAVCPTTSLAAVPTRDATATGAYLRAQKADELDASAQLTASVADIEARAGEIAGECPAALAYAPRDEAFGLFSEEITTVLAYAGAVPDRSALLRTSKAIGHLKWSNSRLTRLVHHLAAEESGDATIALPDVCAEIAAWKASAYVALPESASRFLALSETIESEALVGPSEERREAAILRMLKPYESPADRRIAEHVNRLETQLRSRVSSAISAEKAKLGAKLGASTL